MRKSLAVIGAVALLATATRDPAVHSACYDLRGTYSFGLREERVLPSEFLASDTNVVAAMNGPLVDEDLNVQGRQYLADGLRFGQRFGDPAQAFFIIHRDASMSVSQTAPDEESAFSYVSNRPLLVQNGKVTQDARQARWSTVGPKHRSAIGNDGINLCLYVSKQPRTMVQWAHDLARVGADNALNMDGGRWAGLAVRDTAGVTSYGPMRKPATLIPHVYIRADQ